VPRIFEEETVVISGGIATCLGDSTSVETSTANLAGSNAGETISANASANTKGVYNEIIASLAADSYPILNIRSAGSLADYLFDIAIGANGAEVNIVENLLLSNTGANMSTVKSIMLPILIPAGSRVTMRCQSSVGGEAADVMVYFVGAHPGTHTRCTSYGVVTADSGGTSIDPGATINTKPGWTEIVASTTNVIDSLLVVIGNDKNSVRTVTTWLLDIGTGAAGLEVTKIANIFLSAHSTDDWVSPHCILFTNLNIPAGTRIAAQAQCAIADATDRLFDLALYGFDGEQ
jgi:hypothetical protein